jgi:hypothetical protein
VVPELVNKEELGVVDASLNMNVMLEVEVIVSFIQNK